MTSLVAFAFAVTLQAATATTVVPAGTCLAQGAKFVGIQPIVIGRTVKPPKKLRDVKPSYPDLPKGTSASETWLGEVLLGIDGKAPRSGRFERFN